jgi:hypothetical protein
MPREQMGGYFVSTEKFARSYGEVRDAVFAVPANTNQNDLDREAAALEDGHRLDSLLLPYTVLS